MKKILLLSDEEQLSKGAFECAAMLNELEPVLLVGVFLPRSSYLDTLMYYSGGALAPVFYYTPEDEENVLTERKAIARFEKLCVQQGIAFRIHRAVSFDINHDIQKETRFADLMLLGSDAFEDRLEESITQEYMGNTLHHAECPVLVVPGDFRPPESLVMAYDGSASSVFAIKQFANILPQLTHLETLLVYAHPNASQDFPDKDYIEELAPRHFSNLSFLKLDIQPRTYFDTWLTDRRNTWLIAGAQGRSGVSELFRKSFVGKVLKDHKTTVFIAHR